MTIQVTIKNDHVDSDPNDTSHRIHIRVYDLPTHNLTSEVWVDPGHQHTLHIWKERYLSVSED